MASRESSTSVRQQVMRGRREDSIRFSREQSQLLRELSLSSAAEGTQLSGQGDEEEERARRRTEDIATPPRPIAGRIQRLTRVVDSPTFRRHWSALGEGEVVVEAPSAGSISPDEGPARGLGGGVRTPRSSLSLEQGPEGR